MSRSCLKRYTKIDQGSFFTQYSGILHATNIRNLVSVCPSGLTQPAIDTQPLENDGASRSGSGVLGPSALPSSALPAQNITKPRRHKVVVPSAPSMNDPAFPVQIQEELLNQVRYWTSQAEMKEKLNQEYDTKITEMERIIDALNKQRRMREESDERQKEDQWNLELMNQELRSQNTELQQQLSRAVHENSKIQKALSAASEQLEQFKDKEERTAGQLELTKSRHEQDMMTMRKHTAGIQREKSDLMKKLEELNATVAQQQQKLAKKATMDALALAQEKEKAEQELESPVEAPILIQAPPRLPANDEIVSNLAAPVVVETKTTSLARETSFAHQQSIISELQSKLSQEITAKEQLVAAKEELLNEKEELVKMLADREETIETLRLESTMGLEPIVHHAADMVGQVSGDLQEPIHDSIIGQDETRGLPVLRPSSPIHAGGLFAELAQAKSTEEPIKPTVEYKDQEAMTEPIESWIHTIPGFVPAPTPAPAAQEQTKVGAEIKVGTETKVETETTSIATKVETETTSITTKIETETNSIATNTDVKSLADGTTSTDDLPAPSTASTAVDAVQPKTEASSAPKQLAKTMVDNTTSTDDLPSPSVLRADTLTELVSTKTLVDSATSTDDLPVTKASTSESSIKATVTSAIRNGLPANIITRRLDVETKSINSLDSNNVTTPTVNSLEIASIRLPEILDQVHEIAQAKPVEPAFVEPYAAEESLAPEEAKVVNNLELEITEPVPRFMLSDIPLDDERRHTCDMSQGMTDSSSQAVPPVPAIPKDIARSRPSTVVKSTEIQEFRVSFGSAFGDAGGSATDTGRIEPMYSSARDDDEMVSDRQQYHSNDQIEGEGEQQAKLLSPGRPATGPPSTLLARAAARASMVPELDTESFGNNAASNGTNYSNEEISYSTSIAHPASPPLTFPPRAASIRSVSMRSEKRFASSSPPPPHPRPPMSTGAAVISGTTRTAYTFQNSSSQVHVPQSQQLSQQSQYQHITDSSGASIGRSRYRPSPSGSVSSMSTDYGAPHLDRRLSVSSNYDGASTPTDPTMIQLITQTMIGDYLWKYTRRPMASVISEKRHRRYFWVHPYTKTMYWSLNNPAADGSREQRAKSALIVNVYQVTDENPSGNSDLPNVSLLVQTSSRNLKLTAPTREKHDHWFKSLAYLLSRPTTPGADIATDNQTWSEVQAARGVNSDTLLTIKNEKSVRKKSSFNRLQNMFGRSKDVSPSGSPRSANAVTVPESSLNSGVSSFSANHNGSFGGVNTSDGANAADSMTILDNGGETGSVVDSVVGYPSHMVNAQNAVGGYGTMNGGRITSHADEVDRDEDDDEDVELPEHVRQCCDGKHDIGALHHH
ncbi:hypothetical protein BC939DRAFT_456957 [Gamsiella multidivaricata]|uniref:uncharacterized protein n=1 Tax=Gamsiella multidivaricata TaxID=101098 RepID=UPI00221F89FE|nr:uncharacterized protein BC939DRAFT_456957 [Gamsiella multidivaricata]KAI7820790.1 hypothetical protein BC939DRAFT_456957 [Gamsiella multidivaricata]